jgi:small conductance mechanosensitive channel
MTGNTNYLYEVFRQLGLSDFGARTGEFFLGRPLRIVAIALIAWLIARVGSNGMARFIRTVHGRSPLRAASPRAAARTATMADVMSRLVRVAVWVVAALLIVGSFGIDLGPVLAGASVMGVALGFGAQSLVRDMLAGLFVVSEDQYGVGDTVDLGQASGVVEEVSLRMTRLRATDGTVWFVPNGQVQRVGNSSLDYSRAVVDIPLPYGMELDRVTQVLTEEASALAGDKAWQDTILDTPEVQGVQQLDTGGLTVRVVVKTQPDKRAAVARELTRRALGRLTREGLRPSA